MTAFQTYVVGDTFYIQAPISFELCQAFYENPLAIAEGDPTAPKIAIDVGGQTAIETDETSTSKVLRPDGAGGVEWGTEGSSSLPNFHYYGGGGTAAINGYSSYHNTGWTYSGTNGEFTVPEDGIYSVSFGFYSATAAATVELQKNGSAVPGLVTNLSLGARSACYHLTLTSGQKLRLRVNSPGSPTISNAFMSASRL